LIGATEVPRSEEGLDKDKIKTDRTKPRKSALRFSGFLLSKIV